MRDHIVFPSDPEFNEFLTEYQKESERASVVLAGAYLDHQLCRLLNATLVDESTDCSRLTKRGPLGSFSSRITACYAFGLITKEERDDLDQARDIRNKFSHELHGLSFGDVDIARACGTFKCNAEAFGRLGESLRHYPRDSRALFNLAAALLAYYLKRRVDNAERRPFAVPPLWPK